MMALFCIPKHLVQKLKDSAIKGEVNVRELYKMSSKERREFFTKHTDSQLGELLNSKFEEAMVSKQKEAMLDWAKSVFTPEAKTKPVYKTVLDKINNLDELGVLNPKTERAFLEDLVSDKLGVRITPDEIRVIDANAKRIQGAQEKLGDGLGDPARIAENTAFFKAKKQMDDYLQSLTPTSKVRVVTSTIGRGMMLASIKSPLLNIGSNIEIGLLEAFARRVSSRRWKGPDSKLATDYVKMVNKIYKETGYDVSRMQNLNDTGASGRRVLGNETSHTEGPGAIRATGRVVEDLVFKNLMGAPDVAFSSVHFADSAGLHSMSIAKGNKAKAREIMNDAMRIEPKTPEGEIVRQQAILDAEYATWTNVSKATAFSEGVRKILNDLSGNLRFGDYTQPFVRTPSNVVATGLDYAGLGVPKALAKLYRGFKNGTLGEKDVVAGITRDITRSGLGITAALIIANQLDPEDFVGPYDPRRKQLEQLRNSNTSMIRVGGKWISTDWLGPLSGPVIAMMFAKSYGDDPKQKSFQYAVGMTSSLRNLPVFDAVPLFVDDFLMGKSGTFEELTDDSKEYLIRELQARLVPGVFRDLAKAIDVKERDTTKLSGFKKVAASLPFLSMGLPEKRDIFGEVIIGEPAWSDILFGARVKTDKENPLVKELNRVSDSVDKGIVFTDWTTSSSKRLQQFAYFVGSKKYDQARVEYGQELKRLLESAMRAPEYAELSDEDKLRLINGKDADAMETIFKQYGFKYQTEKNTKLPNI